MKLVDSMDISKACAAQNSEVLVNTLDGGIRQCISGRPLQNNPWGSPYQGKLTENGVDIYYIDNGCYTGTDNINFEYILLRHFLWM